MSSNFKPRITVKFVLRLFQDRDVFYQQQEHRIKYFTQEPERKILLASIKNLSAPHNTLNSNFNLSGSRDNDSAHCKFKSVRVSGSQRIFTESLRLSLIQISSAYKGGTREVENSTL